MTNEENAASILARYGYNTRLDSGTFSEIKVGVIQVLDLADEGKYDEAKKRAQALDAPVRAEVEAVIYEKGGKK